MLILGRLANDTPTFQADCIRPCASGGYLGRLSPDSSLCLYSSLRTAVAAVYKDLSHHRRFGVPRRVIVAGDGLRWLSLIAYFC